MKSLRIVTKFASNTEIITLIQKIFDQNNYLVFKFIININLLNDENFLIYKYFFNSKNKLMRNQ